jgi:Ca2+-binding EF-hand superfamily protein
VFQQEDKNGDQKLDALEFRRFYVKVISNTPLRLDDPSFVWDGAFRLFDMNDDSLVTLAEAWDKIKIPNIAPVNYDPVIVANMSEDDYFNACRVLYNRADANNDRKIDFTEFKKLYMKIHPQSQLDRGSEAQW